MGYAVLTGLFIGLLVAKWKYYNNFTHKDK